MPVSFNANYDISLFCSRIYFKECNGNNIYRTTFKRYYDPFCVWHNILGCDRGMISTLKYHSFTIQKCYHAQPLHWTNKDLKRQCDHFYLVTLTFKIYLCEDDLKPRDLDHRSHEYTTTHATKNPECNDEITLFQ